MLMASATSRRVEVQAGGAHAVGLEHQLRQVELQVGVHAADLRVGLQLLLQLGGDAAHLLQVRALDHELQRLRALALHQAEGAREGAARRRSARGRAACALITSACERSRSRRGFMRATSVAWLTCCAEPRPMTPNSVTISG